MSLLCFFETWQKMQYMSKSNLIFSRLEYAKTLFSAGLERGGNGDLVKCKDWMRKTDQLLADAKKDNDFIYHERIPDVKSLAQVGKAVVAKPTSPLPDR